MIIEKKQKKIDKHLFRWNYFDLAREGLESILKTKELSDRKILLPSYIGYSSKEGSGVFDPITNTQMKYVFYRMDENLNINIDSLKSKIRENKDGILFLIHYFGFMDKKIKIIKKFARRHNMIIIEDFAHAFFTFWRNPLIDFDYGIFSIHKLFPVESGGMVLSGKTIGDGVNNGKCEHDMFNYNIDQIAKKRIENYKHILNLLKDTALEHKITILREKLSGAVPQTFPILLCDREHRDKMNFQMNDGGYGTVSLYHDLVKPINDSFDIEHEISNRILNLPVHQDVEKDSLDAMIDRMFDIAKAKF